MNIVRKFNANSPKFNRTLGNCMDEENQEGASSSSTSSAGPDKVLALMHLRKLFTDFCRSNSSANEYEQKVYRMVPLFIKLVSSFTMEELHAQFKEAPQFASHLSKLFVQEIRKRATHQSTEAAAVAIAKFLEPDGKNNDLQNRGWQLLLSLTYLIQTNNLSVVETVCQTALPSTMVKCLYLFYDLPSAPQGDDKSQEKRQLLYETMMELMSRLLSHNCVGEELARKDDLNLLFSGVSSWCPKHSQIWRRATAQLLMTLSSRVMTQIVINYIHSKGCIGLFLQNLRRGKDLTVVELAEMIVCLFCVLKDSSSSTKVLLEDLKDANGYSFLTEFILANENDPHQDTQDALRNLLLMLNTVVTAGYVELKPVPLTSALYTLPGFSLPQPIGQGCSVRNTHAFQVLENVFMKSNENSICCTVLDVLSSIYCSDAANYFILEPRCTLGQFAETIHSKSETVQVYICSCTSTAKFFELLEYVVFHLNHVPCKELLALSVLLKTQSKAECAVLCMHSMFKLLSHSSVFKDVFREVGILEVLTSLVQSFVDAVKEKKEMPENERNLYFLCLDMLTLLLKQNNSNANLFRECGGTRAVQPLLHYEDCRQSALVLLQQLLTTPGGEDELASLCAVLHSSELEEMTLKTQVLKCLVYVLRESHRVRMAFRRVGGYLYVVSLLVNMEGALKQPPKRFSEQVSIFEILEQLKLIFKVLTLSMRFEPSNAKFFTSEVRYSSLAESLRLLGCFGSEETCLTLVDVDNEKFPELNKLLSAHFNEAFNWKSEDGNDLPTDLPRSLSLVCVVTKLLYDMALDNFEKPSFISRKSEPALVDPPNNNRIISVVPAPAESIIVHPGASLCIMELLPSVYHEDPDKMVSLQLYVAEILKSLVRSERNQQVMCEAGLPRIIFKIASSLFIREDHPLLPPFYYILERLAAHSMQPKELREFLRLDKPLCCRSLDGDDECNENACDFPNEGGPVPLSRMKTLVSMMTPRDFRVAGVSLSPPFVEFDMSVEGFGCIFLPSIAPQSNGTSSVGVGLTPAVLVHSAMSVDSASSIMGGGLGTGERVFPPLTGLTFVCWLYIDRFSDLGAECHPVRLLTITRSIPKNIKGISPSDCPDLCELACLQLQVSPVDHALVIATHETDTPGADLDRDVNSSDSFVRVSIAELRQEQQWCHLAVVLTRAVLKNSSASVYVNGRLHSTHKIHYIVQNPSGGATTLTQAATVKATIGTPPGPFRKQSKLLWRLGPTYLIEDAFSAQTVHQAFRLGANYTGSFQSPVLPRGEKLPSLVSEDKVIFGLNARSVSQMTLARLRKVYNKVDSKAIGRTLGISSHENATPIRILHNSAAHLNGPARSLGGVLIGYLGMRTFCPQPVAKLLESVGGTASLLGLVAMATDTEGLYAAIKALLCAVRSNLTIANDMDNMRGYQTLAMLLKEKSHLLHSHVLHLIFSLVGTLDSSHETTAIPNVQAFEDLLCDLLAWRRASPDLQRLLYEHFYLLITESGDQKENLRIIRQIGLLGRILQIMAADPRLLWTTKEIVFNLIAAILQPQTDNISLLRFGQFIASTVPTAGFIEAEKNFPFDIRDLQTQLFSNECSIDDVNQLILYQVYVRNRCLNILLNVLLHTSGPTNIQICEQVAKVLGFDWILSLISSRSHPATVWAALKILLALTSHSSLMQKFKEGNGNGGWLKEAESVVQNRAGIVLGFSVSARCGSVGSACDLNPEICHTPGFSVLQHILPHHARLPDPYLALLSMLVGQPAKDLPHVHEFDLDGIWSLIFGLPPNHSVADAISKVELCPEASLPLLSLVRRCITLNVDEPWCKQYPMTFIQFLTFLYHNVLDFASYTANEEFLTALTAAVFKDMLVSNVQPAGENVTTKRDGLSDHPAVKPVLDLLRNIIVDSFAVAPATKGDTVIDTILELIPEGTTRHEQSAFATALLHLVMDHLVAADVLLCGQSSSLPLTLSVTNNYSILAANVFYFTTRVVDCIWNGTFISDSQLAFDFIVKLFAQTKRKSGGGVPTDPLYFALNRCLLFMLSRFIDGLNVQMSVLECLQKVTTNRNLIFSSSNCDLEFFGSLCHLLFMLTDVSSREIPLIVDNTDRDPSVAAEEIRLREGSLLVANAARRVWEEMFLSKKQTIEELFRTALVPEINAARALVGESANRCWRNFVDGETRGSVSKDAFQIHSQLQSKIQKVAGGLQRLTSRKTARPLSTIRSVSVSGQTLELWMKVHVSLIRELVELLYNQYLQWHEHTEKWCLDEWRSVEQELTRERGLWGPSSGSNLDKWALDSTEGPCRTRKKLIPNPLFYIHYPYRPNLDMPEYKTLKCKVAISRDSKNYYEKMKLCRSRTMDARILDTSKTIATLSDEKPLLLRDMTEMNASMIRRASKPHPNLVNDEDFDEQSISVDDESKSADQETLNHEVSQSTINESVTSLAHSTEGQTIDDEMAKKINSSLPNPSLVPSIKGPDNQTLLRLLEEGEELQSMFRCARINGLDTSEGLLLFGREHYYVVDGFTLLKTKEIRDLDFLPENLHDPIVPYVANGPQRQQIVKRLCSKFAYEDIREVHKRRYLLQPIALEVFSVDGRNYLLAFPKRMRNKVHSKFIAVARSLTDTANQSVSGQKSSVNLEQSTGLLSSFMGDTSVTQRWVRGEISNFQYLMHLNTLAGRSYNDLSQYPVFPWVVADYDSEELDLTDPASFRDLSKPMGAQTADRLEQFMKRFREWDDPSGGETPPYMYGTHYSSAMIVVSYLVRLEPFTQQFLKLQGGHFDLADRMFHSIKEAWLSASRNNMADVKELIPEFFYIPEFFTNSNNFDLGTKQSGVQLVDVIVPPWAKNDCREFIRIHREALESDYVSAHLHEWIDLIFGYKQQGQAAIDAFNLYHHLFYEGNVDFEAIEDPLTRNATIGFINNFGQIPSQLFKKPHPQKKAKGCYGSAVDPSLPTAGVTTDRLFFHCLDNLKPPSLPIKELKGGVGQIIQNERGQLCAVEQNKVLVPPSFGRYFAWGFADNSVRLGAHDTDKSICVHEMMDCGEILCASCPNNRTVITGSTNTVVSVWEVLMASGRGNPVNLRLKKALYGHTEPVSCVYASGNYGIVVSGSRDASCIVWDLSKLCFIRQLKSHHGPVSAVAVNEATGDIATSSGTHLFIWSINGNLLASVNTAASPKLDNKQMILSLAFSSLNEWDPQHVILTGSNDGVVRMWSLEFVQIPDENAVANGLVSDNEVASSSDKPTGLESSSINTIVRRSTSDHLQVFREEFEAEMLRQRLVQESDESGDRPETPRFCIGASPTEPNSTGPDSGLGTPATGRSASKDFDDVEVFMPGFTTPPMLAPGGVCKLTQANAGMRKQSSSDSFVFLNKDGLAVVKTPNRLKKGFKWQRQLVFRSKLTMHTAFERKDNTAPASITAISTSRDHKTLYVGDSRGRIWAWSVSDTTVGGRADHWVQDPARNSCAQCHQKFSLTERRHHCRNCGQIFCAKCSRFESDIRHLKITKPVRVCQNCYVRLKVMDVSSGSSTP